MINGVSTYKSSRLLKDQGDERMKLVTYEPTANRQKRIFSLSYFKLILHSISVSIWFKLALNFIKLFYAFYLARAQELLLLDNRIIGSDFIVISYDVERFNPNDITLCHPSPPPPLYKHYVLEMPEV